MAQKQPIMDTNNNKPVLRAIDEYMTHCVKLRAMDHMSIDSFVLNCKQLLPVRNYLDTVEEFDYTIRSKIVNGFISTVIKEYIDGKF